MGTTITPELHERMVNHLRGAYPNEGGGLLIGTVNGDTITIRDIAEAENTFPDEEQFHRMGLAPDFWMKVEDAADERGLQIVGFYHSHPDVAANPSEYDLSHAFPNLAYIIVSVKQGEVDHVNNWRLREDRSQFDKDTLDVTEA
ncbi:MAG: M67 family metallopeptidase [Chloroflexota bacterium]